MAVTGETGKPVVGVIGVGIMGGEMAVALRARGYPVLGFDPAPAAMARLRECGGEAVGSAIEVALRAETIIISVASSGALGASVESIAAVVPGRAGARPVVIETSTLPLADKQAAFDALARVDVPVLDCPISGTAVRMKERAWTIFVSGDQAACMRIDPILEVFADNRPYVGAYGNGSRMKLAANHLVAIYNVAYGESMTFCRKMGLDPAQVLALFGQSQVLGSGVLRLRGKMMVAREYLPPTMKVEVWQKDMQVIGDEAKSLGTPTPVFDACRAIYTAAMAQGLGGHDTASTCEVLGRMAGIPEK
jgi:L-threonate 2-dehydrogenase